MNIQVQRPENAFILRMSHGRDRLPEAIAGGEIVLGWSQARGLIETESWVAFRKVLKDTYHPSEPDFRRAGTAAGHAWRFVREMVPGSWVVVPRAGQFYVAQITGNVTYDESKISDDSAYRRQVVWLNGGRSIQRRLARAALQSRMKVQGTTGSASDLVTDIAECVELAANAGGAQPTFATDLRSRLITQTLEELRSGRIDSYGFERVIAVLLRATGGKSVRIVPRQLDKGADVIATFRVAGALRLRVAVQAKHHYRQEDAIGKDVVEKLLLGMDAEQADIGMVITWASFSDEAIEFTREVENLGRHVELVDGEELAAMIVDCGLGAVELGSDGRADS